MLSSEDLNKYMDDIPPIPEILKQCKVALDDGDMTKAADLASSDRALMSYFANIVNKPIFGFRDELKNARQIFGVLGLLKVRQLFQSYYSLLLTPKQWDVFKLTNAKYQDIQASFIVRWEAILQKKDMLTQEMAAIVTLIPAAIVVCESIYKDHKETVEMIKSHKAISYEKILYKLSGYNFFDLVKMIAQKWEFCENTIELFDFFKTGKVANEKQQEMMIYLALLINYEISRPTAMESGINDLFELDFQYPPEYIEFFYETMEEVET